MSVWLSNRIEGRKKSTNENLTFQKFLDMLNGFGGKTKGKIVYYEGRARDLKLCCVVPSDMIDFLREKFSEDSQHYTVVGHQVYEGKKDEKHYFKVYYGDIEGKFGKTVIRGHPYRTASIDFIDFIIKN